MMADSILRCKSKDFAKQIVLLCRDVKIKTKESVLTNQLLRSGTSSVYTPLHHECGTIRKTLIASLKTAKEGL